MIINKTKYNNLKFRCECGSESYEEQTNKVIEGSMFNHIKCGMCKKDIIFQI